METRKRAWGNQYRTTVVCIDSYDGGIPSGRFYNPYLTQGEGFGSLIEFLKKMDQALNDMLFPQSYTGARAFAPAQHSFPDSPPSTSSMRKGHLATFCLRIYFRRNASWQGSVSWLEGRKEESFRSALELMFLMDSALSGKMSAKGRSALSV